MRRLIFLFVLLPLMSFAQKREGDKCWPPSYYETAKTTIYSSQDRVLKVGVAAHKNHAGMVLKVYYADPFYITAKQKIVLKLSGDNELVLKCSQTASAEPMHQKRGDFYYYNYAYFPLSDEALQMLSFHNVKSVKVQLDGDAPLMFDGLKKWDAYEIKRQVQEVQKQYLVDRGYNYDY